MSLFGIGSRNRSQKWPRSRNGFGMGALACVVVMGCSGSVLAQNEDALKLLTDAREAVRSAKDITYTAHLPKGEGLFASAMAVGDGTVQMVRVDVPGSSFPFAIRVDGNGTDVSSKPPFEIDILRTPDLTTFINHEKKVVVEQREFAARNEAGMVDTMMIVPEMLESEPYSREMDAESFEILDDVTLNGVVCDVVKVNYPKAKPATTKYPNGLQRRSYVSTVWTFAKSDHLPRKVDRVTGDPSSFTLTISQELRDVKIDQGVTVEELAIDTPEGYTRREASSRATGTTRPTTTPRRPLQNEHIPEEGADGYEDDATPTPPAEPAQPLAPPFEIETTDGATISNADLTGRVTVLYFWGSWCSACLDVSPLISDLVTDFEDKPVSVYGVAVRERSVSNPEQAMDRHEYRFTLATQPGDQLGTLNVPTKFKVRMYPTVVVIGPDGRILGQESLMTSEGASALADAVRNQVTDALARISEG